MQRDSIASQEYLLVDYAQRLERHRQGRRAVHIHLSDLKAQNRREHHIRVAANTFEELVKQFEGQLFWMSNNDLVFVCKDASLSDIDEAVMRLRYLFSEDPLTQTGEEEDRFVTWYNIEVQYPKFLKLCQDLYEDEQKRLRRLQAAASQSGEDTIDNRKPLSPEQLGRLEQFLRQADLSSVLRRQQVCAVAGASAPKPVFKELFVSIGDLAKTVLPEVNLSANRWLFQHLTITLDRRVLKVLARADDSDMHSSFSINMNVETLLSPAFLEFDSSLRTGSRGTIVVEVHLMDVVSDVSAFHFARDFVREKGYRICLDGVTDMTLPFVDRQKLGVDLVKLFAGANVESGMTDDQESALQEQFDKIGKARIILNRVDSASVVRFGQKHGISMFQGRYIDQLLAQENRKPSGQSLRRPRRSA